MDFKWEGLVAPTTYNPANFDAQYDTSDSISTFTPNKLIVKLPIQYEHSLLFGTNDEGWASDDEEGIYTGHFYIPSAYGALNAYGAEDGFEVENDACPWRKVGIAGDTNQFSIVVHLLRVTLEYYGTQTFTIIDTPSEKGRCKVSFTFQTGNTPSVAVDQSAHLVVELHNYFTGVTKPVPADFKVDYEIYFKRKS